jgi:hypothetical protein
LIWTISSIPEIGTASQPQKMGEGKRVPATDRRGLGTAKEHTRFAPAIPRHPAADPRPGSAYEGALASLVW